MRNYRIHRSHFIGPKCRVLASQKEDFASVFLTNLSRKVCTAVAGVKGANIGIRLLESCVLRARYREVTHDVERVAPTGCPARNKGNDDFWHEPDKTLHLENVQAAGPRGINS